ncbi:hypothetical protein BAE44_0003713 [Dichanthelium oligosanthes]|uniref:Uncharacterized protein n=1 Tax=Dichanthelium oligosanthes TaxID=888268 RepID=A0A1E5WCV8_9POAL|nr:hypothetical protein BAE44_0003713 [Dichanthelium oligosanthes]
MDSATALRRSGPLSRLRSLSTTLQSSTDWGLGHSVSVHSFTLAMLEALALRLAAMLFHMGRQETDMLLGVPGEISKLQRMFSGLSSILVDAERNHICDGNAAVGN